MHFEYINQIPIRFVCFFNIMKISEELATVTLEDVHNFRTKFLQRIYLQSYIHGNATSEQAVQLYQSIQTMYVNLLFCSYDT